LTEEDFKKETKDGKTETTRWKKGGKKRNAKERASGNIQTQKQVYEGHPRVGNPLCPFCNTDLSIDHILWECKETEDQKTNMDMNKQQWINVKKLGKRNKFVQRNIGTGKKTTIARESTKIAMETRTEEDPHGI
jgi:hypothetical protein